MKQLNLVLAALAATSACAVQDADLAGGALATFSFSPDATSTDRFSMHFTGTVEAGYAAPRPATLVVRVAGQPVVSKAVDLSASLTGALDVEVPLAAEGPNAVSAELTYEGATLTQLASIDVAMAAPTITQPSYAKAYTPHVGMIATGTVQVAAAAGYAVDAVESSLDGGPWQPATPDGAGGWAVTLRDPDLGDRDVAVRAQVSVDGRVRALTSHATLHVDPIFDCATPDVSMLPSPNMYLTSTQGSTAASENRVLVGYFGAAGKHDVTVVLTGNASGFQGNPLVTVVSQTIAQATADVHVAVNTGLLRCDTGQNQTACATNYNLAALVDGVQVCATTGGAGGTFFGQVRRIFF